MGSSQGEGLIIFHTGDPYTMEASGVWVIKPTNPVTEAHPLVINKGNPIAALIISISVLLIDSVLDIYEEQEF